MSEQKTVLIECMVEMREEEAVALARRMLDEGYDPLLVLAHCREAMDEVGRRFEAGDYFLPELMMAGEMLGQVSDMAKPLIKEAQKEGGGKSHGKVVIGTVHGDLHDIGKNIVTFMLDINGFEVIDLGIDVPSQEFIQAVQTHKPAVIGLSGFLTLAFDSMRETIAAIDAAGLRQNVKIMIGGGQIDEAVRVYTGADAFGLNAIAAVGLCRQWMGVAA